MERACEFAREVKEEIILPSDVMAALEWHSVTPIRSILSFWEDQKRYVRNLVQRVEQAPSNCGQQKPLSQINSRAFMVILKELDMGGEKLVDTNPGWFSVHWANP